MRQRHQELSGRGDVLAFVCRVCDFLPTGSPPDRAGNDRRGRVATGRRARAAEAGTPGTGYSSLSYLQRYPLDALKIDRSFVDQIGRAGGGAAILRIIIDLAKELGMGVIAEAVETPTQVQRLIELQCSHAQGFLLSRPLNAAAAHDLLVRASTKILVHDPVNSEAQVAVAVGA
jgi:predicted signal transduction protein with EAL and GGDEF domain